MITAIVKKNDKPMLNTRISNILFFGFYIVLLAIVMAFHEPWFDEAESWLIARDEQLYDLLFVQPHYEGHPPLWWLILAVPAKLRLPYEASIKTIEFLIASLGEYLFIFKSPFPKWIRYTIPFTYFIFYQYSVQARPYSILVCAVFLLAVLWERRDEKPMTVCAVLGLLCLTSAYGILIAGGISIVWTCEAFKNKTLFVNRKRLIALSLLLAFAIIIITMIRPYSDTYASQIRDGSVTNTLLQRLYYSVFCLPSECFVTSYAGDTSFKMFMPSGPDNVVMTIISLIIWALIVCATWKNRSFVYCLVPYALVAGFASFVYFSFHHLGILLLLFIFSLWIAYPYDMTALSDKRLKCFSLSFIAIGITVNIFWTGISVVNDIRYDFSAGRLLRDYIEEYDLIDYDWISTWVVIFDDENNNIVYEDTHQSSRAVVEVNPYLSAPLTGNSLAGKSYIVHRVPSAHEMQKEIDDITNHPPDLIIGLIDKDFIQHLGLYNNYVLVKEIQYMQSWKNSYPFKSTFIMANDSVSELIKESGTK